MPKYRVRLCEPGDFIHDDSGESSVCAETADEAREFFEDYYGERPEFVHSHIGWPRVVYKRDVDNGDAHEDADPGDTTWEFLRDSGRDLKSSERRFWTRGPITVTIGGEVVGRVVGNHGADALLAEASSKWVERWKATAP